MKSLYSDINTEDEEIRESGRHLLPPEQVETFALTSDIGDLGQVGEPIVFANPDKIGQVRLNPDANNHDITGLVAPSVGKPNKRIVMTNINETYSMRLRNNHFGSSPENRFLFNNPIEQIQPLESIIFQYDTITERYRTISKT
jgi:hypothetical protein